MAHNLFHFLSWVFARYGYGAIFAGVMLENAGLPVPGETLLLFGGLLAHRGILHLKWVILTAVVGATLGDNFGYLVGYRWGTGLMRRISARIYVSSQRFDQSERAVRKYGVWAVIGARFVIGLRTFAGPLAGALRMPFASFITANAVGAVSWAVTMGSTGYVLGSSWQRLVRFTRLIDWIAIAVVAAGLVAYAAWWRGRGRPSSGGA